LNAFSADVLRTLPLLFVFACESAPTARAADPTTPQDPWGVSVPIDGRTFTVRSARIARTPNQDAMLVLGDYEQSCTSNAPPEGRTLFLQIPWGEGVRDVDATAKHAFVDVSAEHETTRTAQVLGATEVLDPWASPGGTVRVRLALEVDGSRLLGDVIALYCR
jgi:hypothetical protein